MQSSPLARVILAEKIDVAKKMVRNGFMGPLSLCVSNWLHVRINYIKCQYLQYLQFLKGFSLSHSGFQAASSINYLRR